MLTVTVSLKSELIFETRMGIPRTSIPPDPEEINKSNLLLAAQTDPEWYLQMNFDCHYRDLLGLVQCLSYTLCKRGTKNLPFKAMYSYGLTKCVFSLQPLVSVYNAELYTVNPLRTGPDCCSIKPTA